MLKIIIKSINMPPEECPICSMFFGPNALCTCIDKSIMLVTLPECPNCPGLRFADDKSLSLHKDHCKKLPPPVVKRGAALRHHPYNGTILSSRLNRLKKVSESGAQPSLPTYETDELCRLMLNFSADPAKKGRNYQCTYCPLQTEDKNLYVSHIKIHLPPSSLVCYQCTQTFDGLLTLQQHRCIP
jgi:hypothetical protein